MYSAVQILDVLKAKGYQGDRQISNINSWLKENGLPENEITFPADGDLPEEKVDLVEIFGKKAISFERTKAVSRVNGSLASNDYNVLGTFSERAKEEYNHKARKGQAVFANADNAELFGIWFKQALINVEGKGRSYAGMQKDRETYTKALGTFPITDGGVLVPQDFEPTLVRLVESYGVARQAIGVTPMMNFTKDVPRRTGGITGAWVAEGGTATASTPTYDMVNLVAKKRMTFSQASNEIIHDSALSIADQVATEIAQDFAKAEDDAAFLGDGTSTYGGFTGITYKFRANHEAAGGTWGTNNDYNAGLVVASGNLYSEFVASDILKLIGRLPAYVFNRGKPAFYMHESVYWSVIEPMALTPASGGTSYELINGQPTYRIRGIPVVFSQVLPATDANDQVGILLGDLSMGAKFGVVNNSLGIASSDQYGFNTDSIYFRGTERVAIKVHDVGNYHATATSRIPGPIVGLVSAHS